MSKEIKYSDKIGDADYSQMHRTIPGAYVIDIDQVEYRSGRGIVAMICVTGNLNDVNHIHYSKSQIWERTKFERKIVAEISTKINVPAYYVIHTKDLSCFQIHNLSDLSSYTQLNEEEYKIWISLL